MRRLERVARNGIAAAEAGRAFIQMTPLASYPMCTLRDRPYPYQMNVCRWWNFESFVNSLPECSPFSGWHLRRTHHQNPIQHTLTLTHTHACTMSQLFGEFAMVFHSWRWSSKFRSALGIKVARLHTTHARSLKLCNLFGNHSYGDA